MSLIQYTNVLFGTDESVLFIHVLNSEVVKYTNVSFGTDESVLFIEVSLIQGVTLYYKQ